MAQAGERVILVDCDLRNPSLSHTLAPNADHGILDVIAGRVALEDAVWTDGANSFTFLPAGVKAPVNCIGDILNSKAMKQLFERLQSRYDAVLVDLSPMMPIQDTRATSGFVDGYVFVLEWGRTDSDMVKYALKDAHSIRQNTVGIVLNKVDVNRLSRHYPRGETYYQDKYYTSYGVTD
jgi:succinoglycan biosynthesis transport protein ExoP